MKRLKLLLCISLCTFSSLLAQPSFSLTPNPVYGDTSSTMEIVGRATIKNLSSTQQTFRWTRTIVRLDNDSICLTQVSDPFNEWFPTVGSKTFTLAAGVEGPMYVSLWDPQESGCCAIVKIKLEELTPPFDSLNAYYYLRTCQPLAVSEIQRAPVNIFPNPVGEYFGLQHAEALSRLALYDGHGKLIRYIPVNSNQQYEVAQLPAGTYFLLLENEQGSIFQVLEFLKG